MLNLLVLDFETYFDETYSLHRMSIPEYVGDPRFHAHGLAVWKPGVGASFHSGITTALRELQQQYGNELERITVAIHNSYFDLFILCHRYGIRVRNFIDPMLLAYQVLGRRGQGAEVGSSLKALAKHFGFPSKGEIDFMRGVRETNAVQSAQLEEYAKRDSEITYQLANKLLPEVSNPRIELPLMMHTVRLFVERSVCVGAGEVEALEKLVHAETEHQLSSCGATPQEISGNKSFEKLLSQALARTGRLLPLKQGKGGPIPAIAKSDQAMQELAHDNDHVVATLAGARLGKKSSDQIIARLDTMRRIAKASDGVLPIQLIYHAAHTGRWAGGGGFNIQNLGRTGTGLEIRRLLKPESGYKFVIGDFAQIEARIVAWLAGQMDLLEAFASGRDVYSEFASSTFHREVRKPAESDPTEVQHRLMGDRQVGKQAVLGLGFSMGALRFCNMLRSDPIAASLFTSGQLTPLVCKTIVRRYRERYPRIVDLWKTLEDHFRRAIHGEALEAGRIAFNRFANTVQIVLPSKRIMRYQNPRIQNQIRSIKYLDDYGEVAEFEPSGDGIVYGPGNGISLYGGKLTENVVQAIARDLLAEAILRLEAAGIPVVFHVHDEVVCQVPEQEAKESELLVKQELEAVPAWAGGLPIKCEVTSADRYGK